MTRLIDPPMASASISEVTTLLTSMVWIISAGIRSSCTLRVSPSAEGMRLPLMVTELRSADVPRTCPKRASPWSYCTLIPEIRFSASPMFESGNLPTWSAETTFLMPRLLFCELMARRCPWKAPPITISCNSTPSFSMTSLSSVLPSGMVIFISTGAYPT